MSRDDGFSIADVASDLYDDPKVKSLVRVLVDQERIAKAMAIYTATLLASWRHGCRVTAAESVPLWLDLDPELVAALRQVHLLDPTGRLKSRSWRTWFLPAKDRRDRRRDAGRRGGLASGKRRSSSASSSAEPDRPTGRSVRPTDLPSVTPSRARARGADPPNGGNDQMEPVRQVIAALGGNR